MSRVKKIIALRTKFPDTTKLPTMYMISPASLCVKISRGAVMLSASRKSVAKRRTLGNAEDAEVLGMDRVSHPKCSISF
jgi:hypothetical protein